MAISPLHITVLGAGNEVGRSCIHVRIGGRQILFDVGLRLYGNTATAAAAPEAAEAAEAAPEAAADAADAYRQYPPFERIKLEEIDAVVVTHFHLDHAGALPILTEKYNYTGPILMSAPTKWMAPLLIEDFLKISAHHHHHHHTQQKQQKKNNTQHEITREDIEKCMKKCTTMKLNETKMVGGKKNRLGQTCEELEITMYYAGHVLGATMVMVRMGTRSVLYTGDYTAIEDRHVGGAVVPHNIKPDVVISEATYATINRTNRPEERENAFLQQVAERVRNGGKVLIPIFAMGKTQEVCMLLDRYWEKHNIDVPIYFNAGLTGRANDYHKTFIEWGCETLKKEYFEDGVNGFDWPHIKPLDKSYIDRPGPMVVLASPGQLLAGLSLDIFAKWAPDPKNLVVLPGYCQSGSVGNKVLAGESSITHKGVNVDVRCQIALLSFNTHADSNEIMQFLQYVQAKSVVLVHGQRDKMRHLCARIKRDLGVECWHPSNFAKIEIKPQAFSKVLISRKITAELRKRHAQRLQMHAVDVEEGEHPISLAAHSKEDGLKIPDVSLFFDFKVPFNDSGLMRIDPISLYDENSCDEFSQTQHNDRVIRQCN